MRSLVTILIAFGLSTALTHFFIRWVGARKIVAMENHRTMHTGAIATGGGLPLLAAALLSALALWPYAVAHSILVPCLAALVVVSWADDVKALNPALRLAVHIGATIAAIAALPRDALVFQGVLPFLADRLLAGLALVWFLNLYNFMDGIDGIAAAETVAIAAGYLAVTHAAGGADEALYGLALAAAGASLGFLVWNWAPARIFMGDVGSVPLGFLMGTMMLDLAVRCSLAAALILPLYFAADATITLLARVMRAERPWEPHRSHFYQRAAVALGSHAAVVTRVSMCNAVLILAAVLALRAPLLASAIAAAAVAALLINLERAARSATIPSPR